MSRDLDICLVTLTLVLTTISRTAQVLGQDERNVNNTSVNSVRKTAVSVSHNCFVAQSDPLSSVFCFVATLVGAWGLLLASCAGLTPSSGP